MEGNLIFLQRSGDVIRGVSALLVVEHAEATVIETTRGEHAALRKAAAAAAQDRAAEARHQADPCPLTRHLALRAHGRFLATLEVVHAAGERRAKAEAALAAARRNPDYEP